MPNARLQRSLGLTISFPDCVFFKGQSDSRISFAMLQDAAELAGLGVARMLPEPTAAAFAFGMLQTLDPTKDWGGLSMDDGG